MTPGNTFEAFNLETGKKYNFRVTPRNQYGWGEPVVTSSAVLVEDFVTFPEFDKTLPGQLKVLVDSSIELECKVHQTLITYTKCKSRNQNSSLMIALIPGKK